MCSPDYLNGEAELDLAKLVQYTLITQLHGSGLGLVINHWLDDNNVTIEQSLNCSSLSAIASLTRSGVGISYLPRRIFDAFVTSGQLNIIRSRPTLPKVAYVLLYKKARADRFLRFIASLATDSCDFSSASSSYFSQC
jgi:DNA-binding transcriptional LysR family regulator